MRLIFNLKPGQIQPRIIPLATEVLVRQDLVRRMRVLVLYHSARNSTFFPTDG